jgi:hypothetical protein
MKQFHMDAPFPLVPDDETVLGKLTVHAGAYVVFAKADIGLKDSTSELEGDRVVVRVALQAPGGAEDQTTHIWERPRNSTHRKESIALNVAMSFAATGTLEHPHEFGEIRLVATAVPGNQVDALNVTIIALEVDRVDS